MADPSKLIWLNSNPDDNYHWSSTLDGVRFSDSNAVWYIPSTIALTDSGASCITGPSDYVNFISTHILKGVPIQ